MSAALALAREGRHVLPIHTAWDGRCSCGGLEVNPRCTLGKHPVGKLVPHGVHDATTDPDVIRGWYEGHPYAGVAMRTGRVSGIVVLDLDSKAAVDEAIRRGLPDTDVVRTGRINRPGQKNPLGGGWHWLFRAPEEELSSFEPFPEVEFKAKDHYVVTAPTLHESGKRYKLIPSLSGKLAPVPPWLLEAAYREHEESAGGAAIIATDPDGPPILKGERNVTEFRIACSLRARGADHASILAHLMAVNAARCSPPLDHSEVEKLVRSACRYEPGTAAPQVTQEVHDALGAFAAIVLDTVWRGKAGKTDRSILKALIAIARHFGRIVPAGVRVSISYRDLALAAGVSSQATVRASVVRLTNSAWISPDNAGRAQRHAGAFVLRTRHINLKHTTTGLPKWLCASDESVPGLRWGGVGKSQEELLDHLLALGGRSTVEELADRVGVASSRVSEFRRTRLAPLAEIGVVDVGTDEVTLSAVWEARLLAARGELGELKRERADRVRYEMQRKAFHEGR